MTLEVLESIPGILLVLRIGSRSSPDGTHTLTLELEGRRVTRILCDCPGFRFRSRCHHTSSLEDLAAEVPCPEVIS